MVYLLKHDLIIPRFVTWKYLTITRMHDIKKELIDLDFLKKYDICNAIDLVYNFMQIYLPWSLVKFI